MRTNPASAVDPWRLQLRTLFLYTVQELVPGVVIDLDELLPLPDGTDADLTDWAHKYNLYDDWVHAAALRYLRWASVPDIGDVKFHSCVGGAFYWKPQPSEPPVWRPDTESLKDYQARLDEYVKALPAEADAAGWLEAYDFRNLQTDVAALVRYQVKNMPYKSCTRARRDKSVTRKVIGKLADHLPLTLRTARRSTT